MTPPSDQIFDQWFEARDAAEVAEREIEDRTQQFRLHFQTISTSVIRPEMEKVIQRLKTDAAGVASKSTRRMPSTDHITLWMSLQGDIVALPPQDRNPFLQFDANIPLRRIDVWEGDTIEKRGQQGSISWAVGGSHITGRR